MQHVRLLHLIPKFSTKIPPSDPVHVGLTSSLLMHRTRSDSIQDLPNYRGRNISFFLLASEGFTLLLRSFGSRLFPYYSYTRYILCHPINVLGDCRAKTKIILYKIWLRRKENLL